MYRRFVTGVAVIAAVGLFTATSQTADAHGSHGGFFGGSHGGFFHHHHGSSGSYGSSGGSSCGCNNDCGCSSNTDCGCSSGSGNGEEGRHVDADERGVNDEHHVIREERRDVRGDEYRHGDVIVHDRDSSAHRESSARYDEHSRVKSHDNDADRNHDRDRDKDKHAKDNDQHSRDSKDKDKDKDKDHSDKDNSKDSK
jgi:hypothetical protein